MPLFAAADDEADPADFVRAITASMESVTRQYEPARERLQFQHEQLSEKLDTERSLEQMVAGVYIPPIPPGWDWRKGGRSLLIARAMGYQKMMEDRIPLSLNSQRNQITSGSALNLFLDTAGSSAWEHDELLRRLGKIDPDARSREDRQLLELILTMEAQTVLPADVLDHIRFESGLSGVRLLVEFRRDGRENRWRLHPMPVDDWPVLLATERTFERHRKRVSRTRNQLLLTLDQADLTQADLAEPRRAFKKAVDDLTSTFREFPIKGLPGGQQWKADEWRKANAHVESVRSSMRRLIDLDVIEFPVLVPRRADGRPTSIELLSFMKQNSLRFTAATAEAENNQVAVYRKALAYWNALAAIHLAAKSTERQVAEVEQKLRSLDRQEQMQRTMIIAAPVLTEWIKGLND